MTNVVVYQLLCAADRLTCGELKNRCIEYVLAHADEVCEHPSFTKVSQYAQTSCSFEGGLSRVVAHSNHVLMPSCVCSS